MLKFSSSSGSSDADKHHQCRSSLWLWLDPTMPAFHRCYSGFSLHQSTNQDFSQSAPTQPQYGTLLPRQAVTNLGWDNWLRSSDELCCHFLQSQSSPSALCFPHPPQNHFANLNRLQLVSITDVQYRNAGAMERNSGELVLLPN